MHLKLGPTKCFWTKEMEEVRLFFIFHFFGIMAAYLDTRRRKRSKVNPRVATWSEMSTLTGRSLPYPSRVLEGSCICGSDETPKTGTFNSVISPGGSSPYRKWSTITRETDFPSRGLNICAWRSLCQSSYCNITKDHLILILKKRAMKVKTGFKYVLLIRSCYII